MLEIKDLSVSVEKKAILKDLKLSIEKGQTHVIMGPNGSGKSTLAKIIAGHPLFQVEKGEILFEGKDIFSSLPEQRAQMGIFISFQYPLEIPGVSNFNFLFSAYNALKKARKEKPISEEDFRKIIEDKAKSIGISQEFLDRNVNEGFSGGEKKKNEILQMLVLDPKIAILDEIDSGLDIDALKAIAKAIEEFRKQGKTLLLITHYQRLLNFIKPDFIHVMIEGKIVKTGDASFAEKLEETGYGSLFPKEGEIES